MSDFEHVFDTGDSGWTLILLHGTGGDKDDLVPLGRQLLPGAAILSPDGKVLENGVSRRFFKRLAVGELDIPDLLAQTDDLAAFLTSSVERYSLDPGKLIALGLSNGANIAASLLFQWRKLEREALRERAKADARLSRELHAERLATHRHYEQARRRGRVGRVQRVGGR